MLWYDSTCLNGAGGGTDAVGDAEGDGHKVDMAQRVEGEELHEQEHEDSKYCDELVELHGWVFVGGGEDDDVYRVQTKTMELYRMEEKGAPVMREP